MINLICRPDHEEQLRQRLQSFEALDLTLVEKGVDYNSIGIQFQMEDLDELITFLNDHFLQKKGMTLTGEALDTHAYKEQQYDKLADSVRKSLDMEWIYRIMEGKA